MRCKGSLDIHLHRDELLVSSVEVLLYYSSKEPLIHAKRAYFSYECTREVWRAQEKRQSGRGQQRATLATWVHSKLPASIYNSIYT